MPAQDGTGPQGQGPMTGRGLGLCRGGSGFRRGFGRRRFFIEDLTLTKEQERKILQQEKAEIEKRLKELKD